MQGEHSTLTSTTDEHQHKGCRQDKTSCGNGLGHITLDERCGALPHHDIASKREAERIGVVAEGQNTNQEEHIGKAGHDESFLTGCNGGLQRIVEADEQVR